MDIEKLIESVKVRPLLYESTRKSYKDAEKKRLVWNEIAEEIVFRRKSNCSSDIRK